MRNRKILKTAVGALLTLALIVGAFSAFAINGSAAPESGIASLVYGVDFDNYTGKSQAEAHAFVASQTGMYFTSEVGTSAATNFNLVNDADKGYKLMFDSFAYVNGGVNKDGEKNVFDADKYSRSKSLLDLLFGQGISSSYAFEFDLIIEDVIKPTSESADTKPSSPYRGCSMISFGKYNWVLKATSVGVSTYTRDPDGNFVSNNDGDSQIGYLYGDGAETIEATATNGVAAPDSKIKTGTVTGCMPSGKDKIVAYKIGEPIRVRIEFTKNGTTCKADVYANDVLLKSKHNIPISDVGKAWGIRWGDGSYAKFSIDNLKLILNDCDGAHSASDATLTTKLVENAATNTVSVVKYCTVCGATVDTVSSFDKIQVLNNKYDGLASNIIPSTSYDEYNADGANNPNYLRLDPGIMSTAAEYDYWIVFDYTHTASYKDLGNSQNLADGANRAYKGWNILNNMSKNEMYTSLLRIIPDGWEKGNCDTATNTAGVKDGKFAVYTAPGNGVYKNGDLVTELAIGETANFAIHMDPKTGKYEVYLDGVYAGQGKTGTSGEYTGTDLVYPSYRLGENDGFGKAKYENLAVYLDKHEHTKAYSSTDDIGVIVGYDFLNSAYVCHCGESIPEGDVNEVIVKTNDVYYGGADIQGLPTSGEFWISTDINLRNAEALEEIIGAGDVISIGDFALKAGDIGGLEAVSSTNVTLKVTYTTDILADVEVYVDSEYVKTVKDAELGGADLLCLGNATYSSDVRFNLTKIVKLGTGAPVSVTYNNGVDASIKPCAHVEKAGSAKFIAIDGTKYTGSNVVVKGVNKLLYTFTCTKCGETVYNLQGDTIKMEADRGTIPLDENGNTTARVETAAYFTVNREAISNGSGAYWINFDFRANFSEAQLKVINDRSSGNGTSIFALRIPWMDSSVAPDGFTALFGSGDSYQYVQMMRAYSAPGKTDRAIGINFFQGNGSNPVFIMENGKTYNVSFWVNPTDKAFEYKAYVDGTLMYETIVTDKNLLTLLDPNRPDASIVDEKIKVNSRMFMYRVTDRNCGDFFIENFSMVRAVSLDHEHSSAWCEADEKSIVVTDKVLESYYTCYCGEKIAEGSIDSIVVDAIPNVYENGSYEFTKPAGEFWISADYNVRLADFTDVAGPFACIANGDTNLVSVENDGTVMVEDLYPVTVTGGPNTYNFTVRVIDETSYELFIDGVYIGRYSADLSGDKFTLLTENARFNNIKVVTLGETETPLVPTYTVDDSVRPCWHTVAGGFLSNVVRDENGDLSYTFVCAICGEKVNNAPIIDSHDVETSRVPFADGKITIASGDSNVRYYYLPEDFYGQGTEPYQLEFTLTLDKMISVDSLKNMSSDGTYMMGRSVLCSFGTYTKYNALIRQFPAIDEGGNAYTDRIELRTRNDANSEYLATLKVGESVTLSLYITPDINNVDIYVNGEYVTSRDGEGFSGLTEQFRLGDGTSCNMTFSDFKLMRAGDIGGEHTHTDRYINEDELGASVLIPVEGEVAYYYVCYCGELVECGISDVIVDNAAPLYGLDTEVVMGNVDVFANGNAVVGQFALKSAKALASVVTVDGKALVTIDENGKIYAGTALVDTGIVAVPGEYHGFAILADETSGLIKVYVDGEYFASEACDKLVEITVGDDDAVLHIDQYAIVTLKEGGDREYAIDTTSHVHTFDPYTASLQFNAEMTTITIDYICVECDRPAVDGIVYNLVDDPDTHDVQEVIAPSLENTVPRAHEIIELLNYPLGYNGPIWFSVDVKLVEPVNADDIPLISFIGETVVTVNKGGILKVDGVKIGEIYDEFVNITFSIVEDGDSIKFIVYFDGEYVTEYSFVPETFDGLYIGSDSIITDYKNAKFVIMGNDGQLVVGAYNCGDFSHFFYCDEATLYTADNTTFEFVYTCKVCGLTITEKPVYSWYDSIMDVYERGTLGELATGTEVPENIGYWTITDIIARDFYLGSFHGYVNLIGEGGRSYVLVDDRGNLMLGDGTKLDVKLTPKTNLNLAVFYSALDESIYVYANGKFVGYSTGTLNMGYEVLEDDGVDVFGSKELHDVKFYNIRSICTAATGTPVSLVCVPNPEIVPCYHEYDPDLNIPKEISFDNGVIATKYVCGKCGELVAEVATEDLYDKSLQTDGFVFTDGELKISGTKTFYGSAATMGADAGNYWIKFNLTVNDLFTANVGANKNNNGGGRNFLNFGKNYNSPLRLFAIDDGNGGWVADELLVRSNNNSNAAPVFTMKTGETYEIALSVNPKTKNVDIYVDGQLIISRTGATDASNLYIRFLDGNWGVFTFSEFSFVRTPAHVHTSVYSTQLGGEDFLAYGDRTLNHTYTCYCGEVVNEGIDTIYVDGIRDITTSTEAAIPGSASVATSATPYWISAKVYHNDVDCNVYTYNGEYLVDISGGVYRIGGVATEIAPTSVFDLVSIKVIPAEDTYLVYINGEFAGKGAMDFTVGEALNVKLGGGGVSVKFANIKFVSLKNGSNKFVVGCGDHRFVNDGSFNATVSSTGIVYTCPSCGVVVRTATIGSGANVTASSFTVDGSSSTSSARTKYVDLTNNFSTIIDNTNGGSFYMTFDVKPVDLAGLATGGKSLLTWCPSYPTDYFDDPKTDPNRYIQFIRLFKNPDGDAEIRVTRGNGSGEYDALPGAPVIKKGVTYTMALEVDTATGDYFIYMSEKGNELVYLGKGNINRNGTDKLIHEDYVKYNVRFNDANTGKYDIANVSIFRPETVVDSGFEVETAKHVHLVDTDEASSLTIVDGELVHSFTCKGCHKQVTRANNQNLLPETTAVNYTGVTRGATINVGNAFRAYGEPVYLNFDLKINLADVANMAASGKSSFSFLSIEGEVDNVRVHLLRAYLIEDKATDAYEDLDGDTYADGVIAIRSCANGSSRMVIPAAKNGETYNIGVYFDPSSKTITYYVNGECVGNHKTTNCGCSNYFDGKNFEVAPRLRFIDGSYGNYDFLNLKVAKVTDACLHTNPVSCTEGDTYLCDCGVELATTHNYSIVRDLTGNWLVYTCVDCGAYHVEFANEEIVAELAYTDSNKLAAYLAKTYPPMFAR